MDRWVEIEFDCLPLRTVGRMDVPIDASPKYRERCLHIKEIMETHGAHNTYFLYNARCVYHLTNEPDQGRLEFRFEGAALTDVQDQKTESCVLRVELEKETCAWLTEPIVHWFAETVQRAVAVEFDRYIAAGDLKQAQERIEKLQATSDEAGGYLGMYL